VELAPMQIHGQEASVVLAQLSRRHEYHRLAKVIEPEKVSKAVENNPFGDYVQAIAQQVVEGTTDLSDQAASFLRGTYACLAETVSFSVKGDVDLEAEQREIDAVIEEFSADGMDGQVTAFQEQYSRFKAVRQALTIMHEHHVLKLDAVIPIKYLPEIFTACPVWFCEWKNGGLPDNTSKGDPHPDDVVRFVCDKVGTVPFCHLYQLYNRRTRPISTFTGRDIMPRTIHKLIKAAKHCFDLVVVSTPYHDIATKEWADPNWVRNLDPFLLAFIKDLPFVFVLGRWSGTGLFPLFCDMVADTMDHLKLGIPRIEDLQDCEKPEPWWYFNRQENSSCYYSEISAAAKRIVAAYERNQLFEYLRGEATTNEEAAATVD